jgi:mono/diheme cytochrome c family protein
LAYQPRQGKNVKQSRNALSALGKPVTQATVYGIWFSGIFLGAGILALLVLLVSPPYQGRTIQTAREQAGSLYRDIETTADGNGVAYVKAWEDRIAQGDQKAQAELRGALARGQLNYGRICIGCHFGPTTESSNGPYLGDLYQTPYLTNGQPLTDINVIRFILIGHGNMPAGIPLPEQAVDIMLYLKQATGAKK